MIGLISSSNKQNKKTKKDNTSVVMALGARPRNPAKSGDRLTYDGIETREYDEIKKRKEKKW